MADSFQLKAIITGVNKLSPQLTTMQKDLRKFKGEFKDVISSTAVVGAGIAAAFRCQLNQLSILNQRWLMLKRLLISVMVISQVVQLHSCSWYLLSLYLSHTYLAPQLVPYLVPDLYSLTHQ